MIGGIIALLIIAGVVKFSVDRYLKYKEVTNPIGGRHRGKH